MTDTFDAIVIGMGHQGLIAANLLAQEGLSVAILDLPQHVPGGGAYDLFAEGLRTGPCAHAPVPVDQALAETLGLEERGFIMKPEQTGSFAPVTLQSGGYIHASPSRTGTQRELAKFSKRDADTFMKLSDEVHTLAQILDQVADTLPPYDVSGWKDLWGVFETGRLLAEGGETAQLMFARLMNSSLETVVGDMFESDAVRGFVMSQATLASMTVPGRKGSAAALIQYMLSLGGAKPYRGDWQPLRGSLHHYLRALTQSALDRDVVFMPGQLVEKLVISGTQITGVALKGSDEVLKAGVVLADMNPLILADHLLGPNTLPSDVLAHFSPLRQAGGFVRLKLGLSGLPQFPCLPGFGDDAFMSGEILVAPSPEYIRTARQDRESSGGSHKPILSLVIPSLTTNELAPAGQHSASIIAQYFEPDLPNDPQNWGAVADSVFRALEDVCPGFSKLVTTTAVYMGDNLARSIGPINRESLGGGHPLTQLFGSIFGHHALSATLPYDNLLLCGYGAEASSSPHLNRGGDTASRFVLHKTAA